MNTNKRHFDYRTSAYVFLLIVFVVIVLAFVIATLQESDVIDFNNNFWVNAGFTALQYALFICVFILVCKQYKITGPALYEEISLNKKTSLKNLFIVLLLSGICIVGFILVTSAFGEFLRILGYVDQSSNVDISSFDKYITAVVVFALLAVVVEELFFRGIILKGLLPLGHVQAVVASALLFSLFHLNPSQTMFQFVWGIVLAVVVLRTGNLAYSMVLHFVNNFSILTYTYIAGDFTMLLAWDFKTIVFTVVLAVLAILYIRELIKRLDKGAQGAAQKNNLQQSSHRNSMGKKRIRFFSFENIGYFICVALAGFIWIIQFVG